MMHLKCTCKSIRYSVAGTNMYTRRNSQKMISPQNVKMNHRALMHSQGKGVYKRQRSQGVYTHLWKNAGKLMITSGGAVGTTYLITQISSVDQYFRNPRTGILLTTVSGICVIPLAATRAMLGMCEKFAYVLEEAVESVWIEKTSNSFRSKLVGKDINRIVGELLYAKEFIEITEKRTILQKWGVRYMFKYMINKEQIIKHLAIKTESFSNAETLYTSRLTHLLGSEARQVILLRINDLRLKTTLGSLCVFVIGSLLVLDHDRARNRPNLAQVLRSRQSLSTTSDTSSKSSLKYQESKSL
uniref:Uncharacterized protein n=1 Tax=Aplanochytrium stocchinoi TaxID=215587 RepID=A0A7S3LHM0_9STRA